MGIKDIYRSVAERFAQVTGSTEPQLYEVWHARWPPGYRKSDGKGCQHWLIIVEKNLDGTYGCLMVNTDRGNFTVVAELTAVQAANAGVRHGAFGHHSRIRSVPREALDTCTGALRRDEVLAIESAVVSARQRR